MIGTPELIVIAVVVLILFGGSQLPKLAKGLGGFMHEFEKAKTHGVKEEKKSKKK